MRCAAGQRQGERPSEPEARQKERRATLDSRRRDECTTMAWRNICRLDEKGGPQDSRHQVSQKRPPAGATKQLSKGPESANNQLHDRDLAGLVSAILKAEESKRFPRFDTVANVSCWVEKARSSVERPDDT
uniref:Uncharacterized protein n=1 Tax=Peronospora matthiolae TaxID=2874970 RepID=A0AAV1T045_9STRA